jgi:uncharacterized protein YkwD
MARGTRSLLALLAVLAAVVAAQPISASSDGNTARTLTARDDLEAALLAEINTLRRRHRLAPLRVNIRLRAAADSHSAAMANRGFFAHESADGTTFWKRVVRFYPRARYWAVGENLLWSSPTVDAAGALRMWLNSPPHKRNLLTPRWREIGLSAVYADQAPGVFGGRPVTIVTADFGVRR